MNLIEDSFQTKKEDKTKKAAKIVLISIVILVIAIIGIVAYMIYIDSTTLKVYLNGQLNKDVKELLVFEDDDTIYVPIRRIATYLGYQSYNGEYSDKSETDSKCYVQCENEIANFVLNEKKIYKLNISDSSENYEYFYTSKPVKAINGELCVTVEGMQQAFNTVFSYDKNANRIEIATMPYLIESYQKQVLNYQYTEISSEFNNQKTILDNMLIVKKDRYTGVIEATTGREILEAKYDNIEYLPYTGDFLVESNKKVGIMSKNKEIKVQLLYDSIELMDIDAGLYLAKRDNKYGVIDIRGNTKIYIEYDAIGIDVDRFDKNDIKSKYIIIDNLIPVRKDGKWGLFDKTGKQLVDFEYDSFGYIASNNKEAINLLVIPDYNVMVGCKDNKYTLINAYGEQPFSAFVDDIYMTISSNEKHYYIIANDRKIDAEEYLDRLGVNTTSSGSSNTNNQNNSNSNTNNSNSNNSTNSTDENNNENNEQNNDGIENNESTNNENGNNEQDNGEQYDNGQNNDEQYNEQEY